MSKGLPISQRPDLKDASLSARLDAVFGSLGPAPVAGGWSLRQDVQPFRAGGGIEDYNYSSDEEDPNEGLRPLMPSRLVDSDDDGAAADGSVPPVGRADPDAEADEALLGSEQGEARAARERERLRASLCSRRAFEAEAEEDEFDRVATGTMDQRNRLVDAKPPGFTEVPLDSAWERMHGRWQQQQEQEQQQQQPDILMPNAAPGSGEEEPSAAPPPAALATAMESSPAAANGGGNAAAASRKRFRRGAAEVATGDAEMLGVVAENGGAGPCARGDTPVLSGRGLAGTGAESIGAELCGPPPPFVSDEGGGGGEGAGACGEGTASALAAAVALAEPPPPAPRQRGGRRVQWADFVAAGDDRPARSAGRGSQGGAAEAPSSGNAGPVPDGGGRGRGRGGGRVRLDWQRRGFVPDHVRNPHKYTMYTLDEELMVGGGERSSNDRNGGGVAAPGGGARADNEERQQQEIRQALAQARRAAEAASHAEGHDPQRVETTFGSGIPFRPRASRQQQQQQQGKQQDQAVAECPPSAAAHRHLQPLRIGDRGLGAAVPRGAFMANGEEGGEAGVGVGAAAGSGATSGDAVLRGGGGAGRRHFRARPRQGVEAAQEAAAGGGDDGAGGADGAVVAVDAMQED